MFVRSQEDYFGLRRFSRHSQLYLGRRQSEHCGIRDQHLRPKIIYFPKTLRPVSGFTHHLDVRHVFQQTPQPFPQQDMIVPEDAANLLACENYFG
jgi:hypothetical protein